MKSLDAAVLGATGLVGQKFVELLSRHPSIRVRELVGSEKSRGRSFREFCKSPDGSVSPSILDSRIKGLDERLESEVIFSALPADAANAVEWKLAEQGKTVISKASANRMDPRVPLIIPEVNPEHLELLDAQRRSISGGLLCDPNCTTIILALSLKPLIDNFRIRRVFATSMQALSGAGYPGLSSLDALGNVIPFISGEEEKLADEPRKIFGTIAGGRLKEGDLKIFASCNRVPVAVGHMISVYVELRDPVKIDSVIDAIEGFRGLSELPSAPKKPIVLRSEPDRPQPRIDNDGMSVSVGRLRPGADSKSIAYSVLGDNLVRGAAGAGILDAELLAHRGYL